MTKIIFLSAMLVTAAHAQVQTAPPPPVPGAKPVTVERIQIPGKSLEGNLEGNASTRDALVFLPPGYQKGKQKYAVIYALHGYSIGAEQWSKEIHVPRTIEGAFAQGAREMIVVLPDSKTVHNGSMYSSSPTTGDFENYVARDVVAYMDSHYRTLPVRESRGLVGHSMGGYGASRIGMKHSDVFGSLYIMSPCCLSARPAPDAAIMKALESVKSPADSAKLSFFERATLATASAWSPNPANPPLFLDLPVKDGEPRPEILAKWTANAPLAFVDQYVGGLRRYRGIAIDVGDQDWLRMDAKQLHQVLDLHGIANTFDEYAGDHTNRLGDRFQNHVLPFFSGHLQH
jgi:enterochelin esterase-like enzyme